MAVFTTMAEVQRAQERFKTLGDKKISKENNYFEETLNRLKSLMEKTRADENRFYATCEVENLEQLQEKIDNLSKELDKFLNINSKDIIDTVIKMSFNKTMEDILNKPEIIQEFAKNEEVIKKCELDSTEFIDFINSFIKIKDGKTRLISTKKGKKVGLAVFDFKVGFDEKKNRINFEGQLPQKWMKKVRNIFEGTNKEEKVKVQSSSIRKALKEYIEEKEMFDNNIKLVVFREIESPAYDVNISESSIKGFLGEVRNNVLFNLLFGGREAIPTGNIRTAGVGKLGGKEIGIDAIIRGANFQIKNYSEVIQGSKTYMFGGNMSAQNFIENRLKAESIVAEILMDFFGSAQYNQVSNIDNINTKKYKSLYDKFGTLSKDIMPKVMMRYIDNIIKVSDTFQAKENPQNLFLGEDNYFNTFFVIDRYIIPSSYIINAIRVALRRKIENNKIFSINFGKDQNKTFEVSSSPTLYIDKEKKEDNSITANELASKVKIGYTIKINLNEVIKEAKAQLEREKKRQAKLKFKI